MVDIFHYPFPLYRLFFCPANRVWGQGYELFFAGRPGNGVASIRPKQGGTVVGVLWKLTEACEKSLDHYEAFPALYGKETVRVRGSDGTEYR
ncbi:gamma-glutamylcyclotransferase family protein, partial [Bilophila wadsworthia]|uniref:gamma-glutamylcyclotransferase family protein n=1 Tax=Bilophila wadsworthia TaxID=35833 RepID=UPI003AF68725